MVINVSLDTRTNILLGRQGENGVTTIEFDTSSWESEFGAGELVIVAQRNGDWHPYPVELTNGTWVVSDADTSRKGRGKVQVSWLVDEQIKKSVIHSTTVLPSIDADIVPPPDPYDTWIDKLSAMEEAGQLAIESADIATTKASEASASAEDALASQTAAALSASSAAQSASDASGSADDADAAAQLAVSSKDDAETAATTATTQATNAAASASAALASEEAADDAAADAIQAKTDAQNAATTATTKAAEALQSAEDALDAQTAAETAEDNASASAGAAATSASEAAASAAEASDLLDVLMQRVSNIEMELEDYVNDGHVENGVAYFMHNDSTLFEITGIGGGGGGGGGDTTNAKLTVTNTSGWLSKTVAEGGECVATFTWSSIEDDMPTGNGTLRITNNGSVRATKEIQQGNVSVDLAPYLVSGQNMLKVQIADVYGQSRTISFSVTVVALSISSTFDTASPFSGDISFPYTPTGAVAKTVHFVLDGTEIATYQTSVSGRQLTQLIPQQEHGGHNLRVYFTATINEETVSSNVLYFEFMSIEDGEDEVIIVSPYNKTTEQQYSSIQIPYSVYDPSDLTAEVEIYANQTKVATLTVDRTVQSYTYRANTYGTLTIEIKSGTATKTITINVLETDIDVEAETQNLALFLTSEGRSNQEENPNVWESTIDGTTISATMTDFNNVSNGWVTDEDGVTALRVSGGARVTIPYQPFATDFRNTGKTIELEFATRDVLNYDATVISCMSENRGFSVSAQRAIIKSEQSEISTQYKEDEHVRIAFVAEKRSEHRLLFIYINGIASGVVQYPVDDDFSQTTPVNISIGTDDCTTDVYNIRVYDNDLTRFQIVDNWIADTQDGGLMLDRYTRNNVFDAYGNIVISQLPSDLPYMIRSAPELPQYKGDKKTIDVTFVNPLYPAKSFTATGVQSDVQGTSSQYYPRKNYKDKYKNGFNMNSGAQASKYALNPNVVPVNTFTVKADVASSEGANNVELVRLYEEACPYRTPAQQNDPRVRQGIDGFPIVQFWNDGNTTSFLGKQYLCPG